MRAADLAEQIPTVSPDTSAAVVTRIMAEYRLPGALVVDETGHVPRIIPGSQLLAAMLPRYLIEEPALAHVYDENGGDELINGLREATVGDLLERLGDESRRIPTVLPQDTLPEIAAVMVAKHLPLVAVVDEEGEVHGVILISRVLAVLAREAGQDSPGIRSRIATDLRDVREDLR